jgi:hypothetical protein
MAWTQSDLDTIDQRIAEGVKRVTYADGRTIEYQSLDHMMAARKVILSQISIAAAQAGGMVRRRLAAVKSGF